MKITFQNSPETIHENKASVRQHSLHRPMQGFQTPGAERACQLDFGPGQQDRMFADPRRDGLSGISQLQQAAENLDVGLQQDYMTLMSNTMSQEDYAKLEKEGFSFRQLDPEEAVTIVDKIKAELAKAGTRVAGYNDDLDTQTLEAALGSRALAQAVEESFSRADLPLTRENVDSLRRAWAMASCLEQPTEGAYQFLVRDGLAPDIRSFYVAQSSGAGVGSQSSARFYQEDVRGYYTQAADRREPSGKQQETAQLLEQMDKVIRQAGLEVTGESRKDAEWLLEKNLPLTPEKLALYRQVKAVKFPVSEEVFAKAVAEAILEGRDGSLANLARGEDTETVYERANRLLEEYCRKDGEAGGEELLSDRRLLEEIRLRMTTEVNLKLLRSGFAIDTTPMEELVEALRTAEKQVAEQYFPGDQLAVEKYETLQETNQVLQELPGLPARVLGISRITQAPVQAPGDQQIVGEPIELTTVSELYKTGKQLQRELEDAQKSYETLMTSPRADLGDSMQKAFANVEEILRDLGLEVSPENRKAVRVLGYNRMELTAQNIDRVREAQRLVSDVVDKMTPAAVLQMIRDGIHPLEKNFEELKAYFEHLPESYEQQAESYSRFLYRLENQKDITHKERESFVGIYRMLHQIGKRDGAAIGMVLDTGAELQFSSLLAAARSGRAGSLDIRLTDSEEQYLRLVRGDNAIDEQIDRAYRKQELEEIRSSAQVSMDVTECLRRGEITGQADNLLAVRALMAKEGNLFDQLRAHRRIRNAQRTAQTAGEADSGGALDKAMELWEQLDEPGDFRDRYEETMEQLDREVQEETWQEASYLDVKQMRLFHKQLSVMNALSRREEYYLPVEINGRMAQLHLVLDQSGEEKGRVTIELESSTGKTRAQLHLSGGRVSGILQGNGEREVMKLQKASDIFSDYLREESSWSMDAKLPVVDLEKTSDVTATVVRGRKTTDKLFDSPAWDAGREQSQPTREELYHLAKLWIRSMTQKEVGYEN